jgi:FKBP-type peptidyl-prolyl cis-trans isomerase FkpA
MLKNVICLLLLAVVAFSCKSEKTGTTATGYKYIHYVRKSGDKPKANQYAYCNVYIYQNDTLVSSNIMSGVETAMIPYTNPDSAGLDDQPIMAALNLMSAGDSIVIYHNADSLKKYAPPGYPIPKVAYHIQLKAIHDKAQYDKDMQVMMDKRNKEKEVAMQRVGVVEDSLKTIITAQKAGNKDPRVKTTASGLKYILLNEGKGATPKKGENISVNYHGMLMDGNAFDSSFTRGQSIDFAIGTGQVIPGWDEAFMLFKKGTTAVLLIPADLAYGAQGSPPVIPANAELAFYVELL